jgi:hypothetical protein
MKNGITVAREPNGRWLLPAELQEVLDNIKALRAKQIDGPNPRFQPSNVDTNVDSLSLEAK